MVKSKATIKKNSNSNKVSDETFYRHQRSLNVIKKLLTDTLKVIRNYTSRKKKKKALRTCDTRINS